MIKLRFIMKDFRFRFELMQNCLVLSYFVVFKFF